MPHRLTADVVTGKLDVRTAGDLPDEAESIDTTDDLPEEPEVETEANPTE